MRPTAMHRLAHAGTHMEAPKPWHDVPKVTGDYDFDATILHGKNRDMPARLALYCKGSGGGGKAYGPNTAYDGYKNYHGDT